ncbi:hypothetical protein ACFO4E_13255 [Nocardiopsis mangrovi]|uniref:VWFA domain-containing protein n=1 Tax=Nocardiopsis mangrovi TaxID=1179818 RepID=A0ABV9DZR6_9ACTN
MSYSAEISRVNPSAFIFLIDQSHSMIDSIGGEQRRPKMDVVADSLNRLLTELVVKCAKEEGVRDYFHIAVLGYGNRNVASALPAGLGGSGPAPVSVIADNPLRVDKKMRKVPDGAGGLVELETDFPIWVEPAANGSTPMCQALNRATEIARAWVDEHRYGFPPIVLNLTDGEANDGDPVESAAQLTSVATEDGGVLLFNLHVSDSSRTPVTFPDDPAGLPDAYARTLFAMSSGLPPHMRAYAGQNGYTTSESTRGFVYNADMVSLVQFLDIGTRALALR